jgi:hypothetical protein
MSYDVILSVMQVEFPVGMVIFNDKMGKILKTVFSNMFYKIFSEFYDEKGGKYQSG